jgi:Na+-transporting methylmalonyl-CoA/oxaloacetate decarboxylase gamma subunit
MKNLVLAFLIVFAITSMYGCSQITKTEIKKDDSEAQENIEIQNDELEKKDEAITKAIQYHNGSEDVKTPYTFPIIKEGDTIWKVVHVGGRYPGNTFDLEMTIEVKHTGNHYVVILIEDFNAVINDKKVLSYWEYEVTGENVKLIDKNEGGYFIQMIK